jgi:hypothetical protein
MSLIEGFGDEVTLFLAIILILLVVCLAWISTNIRDIPFFSVIIIELTHRRNRDTPNSNTNPSEGQSSTDITPEISQTSSEIDVQNILDVRSTEISPVAQSEIPTESSRTGQNNEAPHEENTEETLDTSPQTQSPEESKSENPDLSRDLESKSENPDLSRDLTESELRQRRINFFQGSKDGATISNAQTLTDSSNSVKRLSPLEYSDTRTLAESSNSVKRSSSQENSDSSSGPANVQQETAPESNPQDTVLDSIPSEAVQTQETDAITGLITVRLKYLNDTQRNVTAAPNVTIGQFRRSVNQISKVFMLLLQSGVLLNSVI